MSLALRARLLETGSTGSGRYLALAVTLLVGTFAAYVAGVFAVSGGVVFVPGHATLVALAAALPVGYRRDGLALAWLLAFGPYLGFRADWAFFGLSGRTLAEQVAYFVEPGGIGVLAAFAVVFGTVGFLVGAALRWGVGTVRRDSAAT